MLQDPSPPRTLESDGIIEDSQRQESSLYEASPPRSVVPKGHTSAETAGKSQETISRRVQEGEARETRRKEVQQGEETSKEPPR